MILMPHSSGFSFTGTDVFHHTHALRGQTGREVNPGNINPVPQGPLPMLGLCTSLAAEMDKGPYALTLPDTLVHEDGLYMGYGGHYGAADDSAMAPQLLRQFNDGDITYDVKG